MYQFAMCYWNAQEALYYNHKIILQRGTLSGYAIMFVVTI